MKLHLSKEKMKKIDLKLIINSVVDDYNSIYETKEVLRLIYYLKIERILY